MGRAQSVRVRRPEQGNRVIQLTGRRHENHRAPRVGLFGKVGAWNTGNDASMESVLAYLGSRHGEVVVDAMCTGPERVTEMYGIPAIPLFWQQRYEERVSGVAGIAMKVLGKGVDAFRTGAWVRRHEVVIVPGAGVLEASLPLWPWGFPYALFLLCAWGRVFGTKVALVSVGAAPIRQPITRWLSNEAARLAFYRSYRDAGAREAMRQRGLNVERDHVYPDLVFALPTPDHGSVTSPLGRHPGSPNLVGLGVMAYYGSNDERRHADSIYSTYVSQMKDLLLWLIDSGSDVRLFVGDANGSDDAVVQELVAHVRSSRPDLEPSRIISDPIRTFDDLMVAMLSVDVMIAMRYHNLVCALKLCKPTLSIGYSPKHDVLMADRGLERYCQSVDSLDIKRLKEQFRELQSRSAELREFMQKRNAEDACRLESQFAELSEVLFATPEEDRSQRSRRVSCDGAGSCS
jgi:polysaccharide pyruvyl transferase WcaK-like protein